ncbi:MAG: pyridoxamine 5'-phosphate oxidase family protein [Candidatus Omnitrophica bacterium]|jgi:predicted pyridoxine 5'-phosphate oxidase superfamily flavin-nucleotide-binding protein|nr:pyridoxamine 5'-phosphate oxidase family protein [Candidatus Omnitrophota bacterium]
MLPEKIRGLLKQKEFISVATSSLKGKPNAAPKFILKCEGNFIYLIDYTIGTTWENLKVNPLISLSFMDTETLLGYQLNGKAHILENGHEYEKIFHELSQKQVSLSASRIIEGISKGKKHSSFELAIPEKFVVLRIEVKELVEIKPSGGLQREQM